MSVRRRVARLSLIVALLLSVPDLVSVDVGALVGDGEEGSAEASDLLRESADAVRRAGSLHYALDMQMTMTSIRGDSWTQEARLTGDYVAPDRLRGVLIVTNPWSATRSEVIVADGEAYVTDPQTGEWVTGLKLAMSYYPVIIAGCLIRMAEGDTDDLAIVGIERLDGVQVYHLAGPGGARDELELEYWTGVEDGLLRKAAVRTGARPGWSDEAYTIRISATLTVSGFGEPTMITPPIGR